MTYPISDSDWHLALTGSEEQRRRWIQIIANQAHCDGRSAGIEEGASAVQEATLPRHTVRDCPNDPALVLSAIVAAKH